MTLSILDACSASPGSQLQAAASPLDANEQFPIRSIEELELMHQYATHTANTMAQREDMRYVWRVLVPRQGFSHHFVLRGVLSLAAIHMAYLVPARRRRFLDLAAEHQTIGLARFREILASVYDAEEGASRDALLDQLWQPLFCFGNLTIGYVCALPARSAGQRGLPEPLKSTMELFDFVRGIKLVLGSFLHRVGRSQYAPLGMGVWFDPQNFDKTDGILFRSILPLDTLDALDSIEVWFEAFAAENPDLNAELHALYLSTLEALRTSVKQLALAGQDPEIGVIMIWAYLVPREIMAEMRASSPRALVLLAHWAALFSLMDSRYWWVAGWGGALLSQIEEELPALYQSQLAWPRTNIVRKVQ
ncbi:hypothetical protein CSOJ01_07519 [Colletotrichum sojae]|uniref:C6 zinc finger protein n=1 Tax=Colletotrichum sojae TaxID=2175907 RepID=A0A8H6J9H6_9PEZI|nr:hypothetical protein CSOJ01_07519 [Colletotrichum sojae]